MNYDGPCEEKKEVRQNITLEKVEKISLEMSILEERLKELENKISFILSPLVPGREPKEETQECIHSELLDKLYLLEQHCEQNISMINRIIDRVI